MGCFGGDGKENPPCNGPKMEGRGCTDVAFLLLFVVFWVGMFILASVAISDGCDKGPDYCNDPKRLIFGFDSLGRMCGGKNIEENWDYTNRRNLYFPFPADISTRVCLEKCPGGFNGSVSFAVEHMVCKEGVEPSLLKAMSECWFAYDTTEVLFKCLPINGAVDALNSGVGAQVTAGALSAVGVQNDLVTSFLTDPVRSVNEQFAQVVQYWWLFAAAVGVALVLSFIWLIFLRLFASIMVWISIISVLLLLAISTLLFMVKAGKVQVALVDQIVDASGVPLDSVQVDQNIAFGIGIVLGVLTVLFLLVTIFLIKRIIIAVAIIKEAAKTIADMPSMILFPLVTFFSLCVLLAYWLAVLMYLASAGEFDRKTMTFSYGDQAASINTPWSDIALNTSLAGIVNSTSDQVSGITRDQLFKGMIAYHIFGLLWSYAVTVGVSYMTIAGAVAQWYFTHDKKNVPMMPVMRSFFRTVRYHVGTVCFGGLIIAIVQFIRLMFNYIVSKMKAAENNPVIKVIICCVNCCLACLERFVKFISKNAYIQCAIHGYSFCKSARTAMSLLLANIMRLSAVTLVADFLLFLGCLAVTGGCVVIGFCYFTFSAKISAPYIVLVLLGVIGFIVAKAFLNVYQTAIDTVFLCFCEDSDHNDGSDARPYFMSDSLKKVLGVSNKVTPSDS